MDKRAVILAAVVSFGFMAVVLRLADLMLVNHKRLVELAAIQHTIRKDIPVRRGNIYDRRGRELAVNLDVESAYCNPAEIAAKKEAAARIAKAAAADYEVVLKAVSSKRKFAWIKRKLDPENARRLEKLKMDGMGFLTETKRFYPKRKLASHVIGFVGIDDQALGGIEYKSDSVLKGTDREVYIIRDAGGRTLSDGHDLHDIGDSIVLTIDEGLQYIVENAIDEAVRKWGPRAATAIMMDPYTGEILAMANRPTFDPNSPLDYKTPMRRNRAITDTYEPGSTFKLIAAAAAVEEGKIGPNTKFDCGKGVIEVGGRIVHDEHKSGVITFREVIQRSSNVGVVQAAEIIGKELLHEYAHRLGFGEETGVDLPGEAPGRLRSLSEWTDVSVSAVSIGYEVAVTPLQVLRAYATVANGGELVRPFVVREVRSPSGAVVFRTAPERRRVISPETAYVLRDMLVSVTSEQGTASSAAIDGNTVAGKTGTSRLVDFEKGGYTKDGYVSSFVGFVPAEKPAFSLIVVLYEPKGEYYGGMVAAPVFGEIAHDALAYMNVPRDDVFDKGVLVVKASGVTQ